MKVAIIAQLCLVALTTAVACSDDSRPPPLGSNAYTCECTCDRCVRRDTTGKCIEFARDTRPDAICSDATCGAVSSDPMTKCMEKCERVGDNCSVTVTQCVESFCTGNSSQPLIAGGEPTSSVLTVLPASSSAVLSVSDKRASTSLSGQIRMTGGECPGASCSLRFDVIRMTGADFEIDGHPITDCQAINDRGFSTTVTPNGTFLIPKDGAAFFFRFLLDGQLSGLRLTNDAPMTGKIDFAAGTLILTASGSTNDAAVDLFITARFTNRPPTAAAGADLTVECTLPHRGVVALDASGTTDPDGLADIDVYGWLEDFDTPGETPLGSGSLLNAELPLGNHAVTLLVGDRAGARDTDDISAAVVDTRPPVVISATVAPACIWPPNHRYVAFRVGKELQVTATDACDPNPPEITIASVVSNEPDDGLGDGATSNDVVFDATTACVRAERAGPGVKRSYTVTVAVADENGHTTLVPFKIAVPHDRRDHPECKGGMQSARDADEDESCRMLAAMTKAAPVGLGEGAPVGSSKRMTGGCSTSGGDGPDGVPLASLTSTVLVVLALRRRRGMSRVAFSAFLAGFAALTTAPVLSGCGGGVEATAYPYICACNCQRCIQQNPTTHECLMMGRQDFVAPACAVDDHEAAGACGDACGRFGTACTWDAGKRASDTPCK